MSCAECAGELPVAVGRGRPRRYCSRRCQARAYRRRRDHGPTTASRRPTAPPTRDGRDPVTVAIALADQLGIGSVSMRLLAERAGLPAHLLYRHVRSRSELLSAMAEQVIDAHRPAVEVGAGREPPADPPARLAALARHEWAMYRRHPWLLGVLAGDRPPTGPAVLAMVDRVVSVFTDAGLDPVAAYRAYLVLSGYVQGMALLIARPPTGTDYRAWRSATHLRLTRTGRLRQRPWLAAASQTSPDRDLDTWFEFGLGRMLDGLLR